MLNQCYDRLRRKPTQPLEAAAEMVDETALPDAGLEQAGLGREVGRVLEGLPERQKAAILLCHFQGASNIEAAEIMDLSVEALESLLARGRRTLRAQLAHLKDFVGEA